MYESDEAWRARQEMYHAEQELRVAQGKLRQTEDDLTRVQGERRIRQMSAMQQADFRNAEGVARTVSMGMVYLVIYFWKELLTISFLFACFSLPFALAMNVTHTLPWLSMLFAPFVILAGGVLSIGVAYAANKGLKMSLVRVALTYGVIVPVTILAILGQMFGLNPEETSSPFAVALGYLIPTALAYARDSASRHHIFLVNLFLGWTGVGWLVSLIWALRAQRDPNFSLERTLQKWCRWM